ncbi:MAG: hypothetical protein QWI73_06405 [Alphaproteobacteria bacterium]|nr:hypothetical protein [Alphaproteobacteria bacterium]
MSTTLGQLNNDQTGGDIEEEIVPQNKPQTRGDSTEDKGDESEKGEEDDHHENTPDHNDHEGEEDNDGNKGKKGPKSNWNLGISLPWLPTARFNLSSIPKSSLVSTGFPHDKDVFICRVLSPCRRMKIMGKVN